MSFIFMSVAFTIHPAFSVNPSLLVVSPCLVHTTVVIYFYLFIYLFIHVKLICTQNVTSTTGGIVLTPICLSVCQFVCLLARRRTQKLSGDFHEMWRAGGPWTREEFIKFWKAMLGLGLELG